MRKFLFLCFTFLSLTSICASSKPITGGISIIDNVPQELFGSWVVTAIQSYTNNPQKYDMMPSLDYWNIYKHDNVLTLENPLSGAKASVTVKEINNNNITFTRVAQKENKKITETPTITIIGENFYGTDKIIINNYKNGTLNSTDVIEFTIKGRKISGASTAQLFK